jgi:Domain of unknown function (DUF397)
MRSHEARQFPQLDWLKSSLCQNGECVEISAWEGKVIMRSTRPNSGYIYFTPEEFGCFLREAKALQYTSSDSCTS